MNIECPICGSNNLQKNLLNEFIKGDLGKEAAFDNVNYKCMECGTEGDFFDESSGSRIHALEKLKKEYVSSTLDYFIDNKISFSSIERVLDLPQRTLTKWKNNVAQPTSAGIALLKFIRLFPWLLEVAENKYDYNTAQKIFIQTAVNKMLHNVIFNQNEFVSNGKAETPLMLK
jgi:transposase-like protein